MAKRAALLVASYEYQDAGLRRLTAPAHDAEALAAVLRDPRIAGFEVTILVNATNHEVGVAISRFFRDRRREDLALLYFTGHGLKDDDGRLYLAMTNTERDSLLFTGLSAESIDHAMESCISQQKVLILDCCYSGAFPAARLAKGDTAVHTLEKFQGRGRTVLTASDSTQYAFEGDELRGQAPQSVFTHYLVEGLREGAADLDGDGDITVDELYSYVHDRVVEEMPQQRPKKQDNVEGRTVIAQNINWSLPFYLRNALKSPIITDRIGALEGLEHLHRIGNSKVREHVRTVVGLLADDDSRQVQAAAMEWLQGRYPTQLTSPEPGVVPEPVAPLDAEVFSPAAVVPPVEKPPPPPGLVEEYPLPPVSLDRRGSAARWNALRLMALVVMVGVATAAILLTLNYYPGHAASGHSPTSTTPSASNSGLSGSSGSASASASARTSSGTLVTSGGEVSTFNTAGIMNLPICGAADVELALTSTVETYSATQWPTFRLAITNTTGAVCRLDLGAKSAALTISDEGSNHVWSSGDCPKVTAARWYAIAASSGSSLTAQFVWPRTTSTPGCSPAGAAGTAAAGTYVARIDVVGILIQPTHEFKLAPFGG
ncbi:caspase domain-containing protein [Streptacidiphilus sp. N1-3]|uniref:Caspase domain-containing protein n=1 Tax=Streptacidiphilus alkalitolerans TaxID=3342712 RepID=A0ABV6X0I5_9ACTN